MKIILYHDQPKIFRVEIPIWNPDHVLWRLQEMEISNIYEEILSFTVRAFDHSKALTQVHLTQTLTWYIRMAGDVGPLIFYQLLAIIYENKFISKFSAFGLFQE